MRTRTALIGAASVLLAIQAPGLAQQPAGGAEPAQAAKDEATNRAILEKLVQRRAEIVRAGPAKGNKEALAFLDKQIAEIRAELGE